MKYNAASPDELALLNFAKFCGFEYLGKDESSNMKITYNGNIEKYKLLEVLEFNSDRKRMSVILKDNQDRILLYSKGADSILFERMNKPIEKQEETLKLLTGYASSGLRTLAVAAREIP